MARTLDLHIQIPDSLPEEAVRMATEQAREAAVLWLQQQGALTIREAAAELGLPYNSYMQLLTARGLPASHDTGDSAVMDTLRRGRRR